MTTTVDLSTSPVPGISTALRGHLARPAGVGPWPGVVVIFEAFGADDTNLKHVERLAAMGYLALMPDLYSDGGARRCLVSTFRALSSGKGRAYHDIEAARQWLLAQPDCSAKVGTVGFCLGGGFALMSANRGFDAAAVNYGAMLPRDLDPVLAGACPVVGSYGRRDNALRGAAAKLAAGLERAGVPHDVKEYPTAGHAYLNEEPNGPRLVHAIGTRVIGLGHDPEAAADTWARIDAFFTAHLG
jgi:carboxymethylenebutenolidase